MVRFLLIPHCSLDSESSLLLTTPSALPPSPSQKQRGGRGCWLRASTHRRSRRCSTSPPGGLQSGSGPGGNWGPALPHTDRGHTLEKGPNAGSENTACWLHPALLWLCPGSSQDPVPRAVPLSLWAFPTLPAPLTAAVTGAAGVLLEVGEESVAWAAGRSEALTQSLVTHWPGGHRTCHLEAGTSPLCCTTAQPLDTWSYFLDPRTPIPGRGL